MIGEKTNEPIKTQEKHVELSVWSARSPNSVTMLKICVYLACFILAAAAAPQNASTEAAEVATTEPAPEEPVEIISNEFEVDAINGSFKYRSESLQPWHLLYYLL